MKYKAYAQFIGYILAALLLVLLQAGFISGLPDGIRGVDLIMIFLLVVLVVTNLRTVFLLTVLCGYFMDVFSFQPFGIYLISYSLTTLFGHFLLVSFFTNRSQYSFLALVGISTVFYGLFLRISDMIFSVSLGEPLHYAMSVHDSLSLALRLSLNLLVALLSFQLVNFASHRLKPVFIFKG
jgi:cell shape-determining protein MreD